MDPEQLVAQLAELRTQNQQSHQALQQMQQEQAQQQGIVQALTDLPQSLAQTVGAVVAAATDPARANPTLVDTKVLGKPSPLKNTEHEFVSWARLTENFVLIVHRCLRSRYKWSKMRTMPQRQSRWRRLSKHVKLPMRLNRRWRTLQSSSQQRQYKKRSKRNQGRHGRHLGGTSCSETSLMIGGDATEAVSYLWLASSYLQHEATIQERVKKYDLCLSITQMMQKNWSVMVC